MQQLQLETHFIWVVSHAQITLLAISYTASEKQTRLLMVVLVVKFFMLLKTVSLEHQLILLEFLLKCGDSTRDDWEGCDEGNVARGDGCNGL